MTTENDTSQVDASVQPQVGTPTQPQAGSDHPSSIKDLAQALSAIDELRKENAKHRKEKQAAEKQATDTEAKRLAEQQEWKKLYDLTKAELDRHAPVIAEADLLREAFNASLNVRLQQIPEDVRRDLVEPARATMTPVDFSNWLDKALPKLRPPQAPPLDGGAGSGSMGTPAKLSPEQLEMAKAMGIAPEVYAKRLKEIQDSKEQKQ